MVICIKSFPPCPLALAPRAHARALLSSSFPPHPRAQAELERGRRMIAHGGDYLISPTHEAIVDELLARADAKALANIAKV